MSHPVDSKPYTFHKNKNEGAIYVLLSVFSVPQLKRWARL
jgi:hypothetical protein